MFGKNKIDLNQLIRDSMSASIPFSEISFIPTDKEILFVVNDAPLANAFMSFVTEYPDADLSDLNIHCKL